MHLVFATRGIKQDVDRMIKNLESLYLPWMINNEKGEKEQAYVQAMLQPVQLWSLVFPKEHLDSMLRTLKPSGTLGQKGAPLQLPNRTLSLAALRKFAGLKPIPKWEPQGSNFPIWNANTQVLGIGIKEDYTNEHGNEAL